MKQFAIFVDGSNLLGSLKKINLQVTDYQAFFKFIFEESVKVWEESIFSKTLIPVQMQRVYWYVLGTMDNLNTSDPKFQAAMKDHFDKDVELKKTYMALAGQKHQGKSQNEIYLEAWKMCFEESKNWYEKKQSLLEGFNNFYYTLRGETDFIDINECGHWKVDFLYRYLSEKGLDTQLAVDIATMAPQYDVALIISGDADSIPSINYVKRLGKQIGTIELIKGHPPDKKGKQFSTRLKAASDFVVQIYQIDLERKKITQPLK